jgi:hypothetical protein
MVIVVLTAMAGASKILLPHVNNEIDQNIAERYEQLSKYLLLSTGKPSDWGQDSYPHPEAFGLSKSGSNSAYELDVDKVSRLNSENEYAISYADIFTSLALSDVSFKLEIKPLFEVAVNLTATFTLVDEMIYQFEISTTKGGAPIQTLLSSYVIAEHYLNPAETSVSDGKTYQNVTIPNNVNGPALLIVFAKYAFDPRIVSFKTHAFAHNAVEPKPAGAFVKLSPLDYVLNASFVCPGVNLSNAYALVFDHNTTLMQITFGNESALYAIPRLLDSSPLLIVLTGSNSTSFFAECVTYPQVPAQTGADFASSASLSNVYVYTYMVTIDSAIYKCTIWLGGPRE